MSKTLYNIDKENLDRILDFFDWELYQQILKVLEDSEKDPHYSAVNARNKIMWLIRIKKDLKEPLPYDDCKGYFSNNVFLEPEDYELFEKKRKRESEYYIGEQF